ncbi:MAG: biliverdin-producing heme oxygenase [Phycisphaerales bacterium]|jgi:heme oxygenase|nr:biliverdin-producing heme oxygenase [Phycisphaerales bacterium]
MTQAASHPLVPDHSPDARVSALPLEQQPISHRLKAGTWDLHQAAENGSLPKALLKGEITRSGFAEVVGQMYLLHKAMDEAILRHRDREPVLGAMIDDEQLQSRYLDADLRALGFDPETVTPLEGTTRAIEHVSGVERSGAANLLAMHYVREGANNGNRFIAMGLKKRWGQNHDAGLTHLDPYGESQRARWAAWKKKIDELAFTPEEKDAMVEAARSMFRAVMDLHGALEHTARAH